MGEDSVGIKEISQEKIAVNERFKAIFDTLKENPKIKIDAAMTGLGLSMGPATGSPEHGLAYGVLGLIARPVIEKAMGKPDQYYTAGGAIGSVPNDTRSAPELLIDAWKTGKSQGQPALT